MRKVYFSGFESVFLKSAYASERYALICAKYGFESLFPVDGNRLKEYNGRPIATLMEQNQAVFRYNTQKIDAADVVIVHLDSFYRICTINTAFEAGYAFSKGKKVIGCLNAGETFNGCLVYNNNEYIVGCTDQPANLMVASAMSYIIQGSMEDCLEQILGKIDILDGDVIE